MSKLRVELMTGRVRILRSSGWHVQGGFVMLTDRDAVPHTFIPLSNVAVIEEIK